MEKKYKNKSHNTTKIDKLKEKFDVAVSRDFMLVIICRNFHAGNIIKRDYECSLKYDCIGINMVKNGIGQLLTIQPQTK